MSSFLPMNFPIAVGLSIAPPTLFNTVFWQWVCQTQNAFCNYGNRNVSAPYGVPDIIRSYIAACFASITLGLGLKKIVGKYTAHLVGGAAFMSNTFSSMLAVAGACFVNAYLMRTAEIKAGISIFDVEDKDCKKPLLVSRSAARKAVL